MVKKSSLQAILILFVNFLLPLQSQANHIMGADIGWKHGSSDTIRVMVWVYRSCNGISLSNTPISYFGTCAGFQNVNTAAAKACCSRDVTPVCKTCCTRCSSPSCTFSFGIEQVELYADIVFPKGCCDWYVSWQQQSRDGAISTGPAGKNFYIEAELNPCLSPADNSPVFNDPPLNLICRGQCVTLSEAATDPDAGDTISYALTSPLEGHGKPAAYTQGLSYSMPLAVNHNSGCSAFSLDASTGSLQFYPSGIDITPIALTVNEYHKDPATGNVVKTGSITRDIETFIIDCGGNHIPALGGINNTSDYTKKACLGQATCFQVTVNDPDPQDTIKLGWTSNISGALVSITDSTPRIKIFHFCWKPGKADLRYTPYTITLTAEDNAKPITGRNSATYSLYVTDTPKADFSFKDKGCGKFIYTGSTNSLSPTNVNGFNWHWWNKDHSINETHSLYLVDSIQLERDETLFCNIIVSGANGCTSTYDSSYKISPFLWAEYNGPTAFCSRSDTFNIAPKIHNGKPPVTFDWNNGSAAPSFSTVVKSDTFVALKVKDASGCVFSKGYQLTYRPGFMPPLNQTQLISPCTLKTIPLSAHGGVPAWWTLYSSGIIIHAFPYKTTTVLAPIPGLYTTTDSQGVCSYTDTFRISLHPPIKTWSQDTAVCYGSPIKLNGGIGGLNNAYYWTDPVNGHTTGASDTFTVRSKTDFTVTVLKSENLNSSTCSKVDTIHIKVFGVRDFKLYQPPPQCLGSFPLPLAPYEPDNAGGGTWSYPRNPKAVVNGYLYTDEMGITGNSKSLGYVHYTYTAINGCYFEDSVKVTVDNYPHVSAGHDTVVCRSSVIYKLSNRYVSPVSFGKWQTAEGTPAAALVLSGSDAFFDISATPADTVYGFIYTYRSITGSSKCDGTDTVYIKVSSSGGQVILNVPDTVCDIQDPVLISASPAGGTFTAADKNTPPGSLIYTPGAATWKIDPKRLSHGAHRFAYVYYTDPAGRGCYVTDTFTVYLAHASSAFTLPNHTLTICTNAGLTRLVPDSEVYGQVFSGKGVVEKNGVWYFDPSHTDTGKVTVTLTTPYGHAQCTKILIQNIIVVPPPEIRFIDSAICGSDSEFTIRAVFKGMQYHKWNAPFKGQDGGFFLKEAVGNDTMIATYVAGAAQRKTGAFVIYLTAWNNAGCDSVHAEAHIKIAGGPHADFVSSREGCDPFALKFKSLATDTSGNINSYSWQFGDGYSSPDKNPSHTYHSNQHDSVTFYSVTFRVQDDKNCAQTITKHDWILIRRSTQPVIDATPERTTLDRPAVHFSISPASRNLYLNDTNTLVEWHFHDRHPTRGQDTISHLKNPVYTYSDTGRYTVVLKVTNAEGCTGIDSAVELIDIRQKFAIFIPTAFFPGKDNNPHFNTVFKPVTLSCKTYQLSVYNRWGELLFETEDPDKGWDGYFHGRPVPAGAYLYSIKATSIIDIPYQYGGTVTVLE